jgi:hypothetical protein
VPRFVPARISHLLHELSVLLPQDDRGAFYELARIVEALYHHASSSQTRTAETLYAPFDPDSETTPAARAQPPNPVGRLYEWLGALFERANFDRVQREDLLTAIDEEVLTNFEIDPDLDAIERLAVYTRGRSAKAVRIRKAANYFRLEEQEIPTYSRVAIVVRTAHDPYVLVKLFKDVPFQDLELLLPTVRVKMKLLDKLKLSGTGGAAALSTWKILRVAYTYAPTITKLIAVPFKLFLLPIALLVTVFYGGKTAMDYGKIKSDYVTALAEHLYAITLASNRAALGRLSRMAGEEDTKEALIAYALLRAEPEGLSPPALRQKAADLVWDRYRARVRFDVEDALRKLIELELVVEETTPAGPHLRALGLDESLRHVDKAWDDLYSPPPRNTRLWRLLRREEDEAG